MQLSTRQFFWVTVAVGILGSSIAVKLLIMLALHDPPADAYIFMTVGRGILNGLRPYTDLFESKPVGVFLLNALSFRLTGGIFLLHIIVGLGTIALPIACAIL